MTGPATKEPHGAQRLDGSRPRSASACVGRGPRRRRPRGPAVPRTGPVRARRTRRRRRVLRAERVPHHDAARRRDRHGGTRRRPRLLRSARAPAPARAAAVRRRVLSARGHDRTERLSDPDVARRALRPVVPRERPPGVRLGRRPAGPVRCDLVAVDGGAVLPAVAGVCWSRCSCSSAIVGSTPRWCCSGPRSRSGCTGSGSRSAARGGSGCRTRPTFGPTGS